jgi:hypothetical protein
MLNGAILANVVLVVLCSTAASAQASPQAEAKPCESQQQIATATPPATPEPVESAKTGAAVLPVAQNQQLRPGEKFKVFLRYTYSPYTFAGVAFNAGISQATGGWYSYGGGMQGYGKRFGAALADTESGAFFGAFLFPVLLHEDPRYFRSKSHGTLSRAGYAVSRVFVTRNEHGGNTTNFSLISGALAASGLANAYYPREDRGAGDTMARAGNGLLSVVEMNLLREFWPDISRKFKKHEPETLKKLEENPHVKKIEQMMMGPVASSPCTPPQRQPEQASKP